MPRVALLRLSLLTIIVIGGYSTPSPAAAASSTYTVTDIGTLVGTSDGQFDALVSTNPIALNEKGVIAGVALTTTSPLWGVAFTSSKGKIRRLGKASQFSFAFGIDDAGDVASYVKDKDDPTFTHQTPVVWRDRRLIELPTLGGDNGSAYGFAPNGDIVGSSTIAPGEESASHATLWHNDKAVDLGTLGGKNSLAYEITADGVAVGYANAEGSDAQTPCVWRDGTPKQLPLSDGMVSGFISNINGAGEMTGTEFDASNAYYAVRWVDDQPERLPGLYDGAIGSAGDINEAGVIVGATSSAPGGALIGAMWVHGQLSLLQDLVPVDSGFTIGTAAGITEDGRIAASATTADGIRHGVLLTPLTGAAMRRSGDGKHGAPIANVAVIAAEFVRRFALR